jgi:undecaprenol kinase
MKRWWWGVKYAFQGIRASYGAEPHLRFHFLAAMVVVTVAAYFQFSRMEWITLLITISFVLSMELLNTAVERAVDVASPDIHPLAKLAKDAAAGAVLVASIFAVIIGVLLFYPYIVEMMKSR